MMLLKTDVTTRRTPIEMREKGKDEGRITDHDAGGGSIK
jgi:hypothetical protein